MTADNVERIGDPGLLGCLLYDFFGSKRACANVQERHEGLGCLSYGPHSEILILAGRAISARKRGGPSYKVSTRFK